MWLQIVLLISGMTHNNLQHINFEKNNRQDIKGKFCVAKFFYKKLFSACDGGSFASQMKYTFADI